MRERHNWGREKHPRTCTCLDCAEMRARERQQFGQKKKRKPKSMRGKGSAKARENVLDQAMDILRDSAKRDPQSEDSSDAGKEDRPDR
ncbi:MAG: hypothetical protein WD208_05715 [Dehalococcoidia bacterium]